MRRIWKFRIPFMGQHGAIEMPKGARIISVGWQNNDPVLWAIVDPHAAPATRNIVVIMTGVDIREGEFAFPFIGTTMNDDGSFVVHIFDGGEVK